MNGKRLQHERFTSTFSGKEKLKIVLLRGGLYNFLCSYICTSGMYFLISGSETLRGCGLSMWEAIKCA